MINTINEIRIKGTKGLKEVLKLIKHAGYISAT